MRILVTGGAGYIGGHFVSEFLEKNLGEVVVVDDFSTGLKRRIPENVKVIELDLSLDAAREELADVLRQDNIDAVIHFAAKKAVAESVDQPELYFRNNFGGTLNVLTAMREAGVKRLVFSSTASVYGEKSGPVVFEGSPEAPINAYGESKLFSERALERAGIAWGLSSVVLRYFNVAGAKNSTLADTTTSNLMPAIRDRMTNSEVLSVFGNDYPTPDGTCIRDYIHIQDLIDAHIVALKSLGAPDATSGTRYYNVGTGSGTSVLEVVQAFQKFPGVELNYDFAPRRPGDVAALMANVDKIAEELGWRSQYLLEDIVESVIVNRPQ